MPDMTDADKARLLDLQARIAQQVTEGQLRLGHLEKFLSLSVEARKALIEGLADKPEASAEKIEPKDRRWREEDGVIYFSVTSNGTTGPEWIARLRNRGFRISSGPALHAALTSEDFKPTTGVTTHVAVLKGMLFPHDQRTTAHFVKEAERRGFGRLHPEVACLARELLTHADLEAMDLWRIAFMHEPVKLSISGLREAYLLRISRDSNAQLDAHPGGKSHFEWHLDHGLAFAVSST